MAESDPLAYGLPHREPFVFVQRVVRVEPGVSAVCESSFPPETPFLAGHFPGNPIVPGVILTEALAQTAGIAAGEQGRPRSFHLTAIRQMKFRRPVRPGEPIEFSAGKTGEAGGLLQFAVRATVGSEWVAEGVIVLAEVAPREDT